MEGKVSILMKVGPTVSPIMSNQASFVKSVPTLLQRMAPSTGSTTPTSLFVFVKTLF